MKVTEVNKVTEASSPKPTKAEKVSKYELLKDARDWVLAAVFLLWGGHGIYTAFFQTKDDDHRFLTREFDKDGDGKLSKTEKDEAKKLMEELGKWKKLNNQIKVIGQ